MLDSASLSRRFRSCLWIERLTLGNVLPHVYPAVPCWVNVHFLRRAAVDSLHKYAHPTINFTSEGRLRGSPCCVRLCGGGGQHQATTVVSALLQVFSQPFSHNERALCEGETRGFIDVYLDSKDQIVGACIMNNRAGELLAEILVSMEKRIPFTEIGLSSVVHPYPTYSWSTMMLATDVKGKRLQESLAGSAIRWLVGRG